MPKPENYGIKNLELLPSWIKKVIIIFKKQLIEKIVILISYHQWKYQGALFDRFNNPKQRQTKNL